MKSTLLIALSILSLGLNAQYKQQLRGTVLDLILQKPLPGATVSIVSTIQRLLTKTEIFDSKTFPLVLIASPLLTQVLKHLHWKTLPLIPEKKPC